MTIGACECFAGKDGSTCWHQYCLWSKGFKLSLISSQNVENVIHLKKAGKRLESFFYEPLHFRKNETYEEEADTLESKTNKLQSKTNDDKFQKTSFRNVR